MLVNTESFQVIDEGDGSSDVSVQFGDALAKTLNYDRTGNQFRFSDSLLVEGNLNVTGSLSGSQLVLTGLTNCDTLDTDATGQLICGTDETATASPLSAVQARRTTNLTIAAANVWTDVPLDSTDVENNPSVIEHNNTNSDNIDIKATGLYQISYQLTANDATVTHQHEVRVRVNDATVVNGSFSVNRNYQNEYGSAVATIVTQLTAGDFVTLQVQRTTNNTVINQTVFTVIKLDGVVGATGPQGPAGADGINGELAKADADTYYVNIGGDTMTGSLTVQGTLSGASIRGAGLTDCDSATDRLQWDQTTGQFSCIRDIPQVNNFVDNTVDTVVDNNTTDYWDGTRPNITLTDSTNEVLVMVTARFQQNTGNNGDDIIQASIARTTNGTDPVCGTSGLVGPQLGTFLSNADSDATVTAVFLDEPATTNNVRYTLCSDAASASIGGDTVEGIHFTLYEVNNAADLAEVYPTNDISIQPGMIVSIDPALPFGVRKSAGTNDETMIGIVSTKPAQVIGGREGLGVTGVPVALAGRVPVKVTTENGAIAPGDYLTSASLGGYAMKSSGVGPVIGQALTGYNEEGFGTVIAFVQKGNLNGNSAPLSSVENLQQLIQSLEARIQELEQR